MAKIDLKQTMKQFYSPSTKACSLVEVPPLHFLMIDGVGNPNDAQAFQDAMQALYTTAYTLKFMLKKSDAALDYTVMPLEGLWWTPDMAQFSAERKDDWLWTMMIAQPDFVTAEHVEAAKVQAAAKKALPSLPLLRYELFNEGLAAQIMHVGPYASETPTILRLHEYIASQGYSRRGKHHEIYMSDPNRTAPEKLKTVIRQPVG